MPPSNEEALFALALAKPAAERAAWLNRECGDDQALRARLGALLAAHEQPETLLATQAEAARPTIKLDLDDAPDEAVGQTLGRYKLLERVGEGEQTGRMQRTVLAARVFGPLRSQCRALPGGGRLHRREPCESPIGQSQN